MLRRRASSLATDTTHEPATHQTCKRERNACQTLRHNRPKWNVVEQDVKTFNAEKFSGVDLFAGSVPCPPFSFAGRRL